jgi:hypothetical protein
MTANGWLYECALLRWLLRAGFAVHFRKAVVISFTLYNLGWYLYYLLRHL